MMRMHEFWMMASSHMSELPPMPEQLPLASFRFQRTDYVPDCLSDIDSDSDVDELCEDLLLALHVNISADIKNVLIKLH